MKTSLAGILVIFAWIASASEKEQKTNHPFIVEESYLGKGKEGPPTQAHQYLKESWVGLGRYRSECCEPSLNDSSGMVTCSSQDGKTLQATVLKTSPASREKTMFNFDVVVKIDGKSAYSFRAVESPVQNSPVLHACWRGRDWILEYRDHVVINGMDLGRQLGYKRVSFYRFIRGRPIFFIDKGKKTVLSLDGNISAYEYDYVIRYGCCEEGLWSAGSDGEKVWFVGRKGDDWYFVKVIPR